MNAIIDYLWYVLRHKWFVYLECRILKVGFWQAAMHDFSKLSRAEFMPYVNHWSRKRTDEDSMVAYLAAWRHHILTNPHHWQYWLDGGVPKEIPEKYIREMVADWRGVGRALRKGRNNAKTWYMEHKPSILLHPKTRRQVEKLLFQD